MGLACGVPLKKTHRIGELRRGLLDVGIRKQEGDPRGLEFRMADDRGGAWKRLNADSRSR